MVNRRFPPRSASSAVAARPTLSNYRDLVPVAQRAAGPITTPATGAKLGGSSRLFFPATDQSQPVGTYVAVLPLFEAFFGGNDTIPGSATTINVGAAVEVAGQVVDFKFSGQHLGVLPPGGSLLPDVPIAAPLVQVTYSAGAGSGTVKGHWFRTFVSKVDAAGAYPINVVPGALTSGEVNGEGEGAPVDLTIPGSGAVTAGTNALASAFGPRAILGAPKSSKLVLVVGDSIPNGQGDSPSMFGYADRAAIASGVPVLKLGRPGDTVATFVQSGNLFRRANAFSGPTHAVLAYGVNDLNNKGRTPAQLKADLTAAVAILKSFGHQVHVATIGPRTTGTFDSPANQVATGSGGTVDPADGADVNDWIRSGASGAAGVFDVADLLMSARNSGKWGLLAGAALTGDGTHPNPLGHQSVLAPAFAAYLAAL